MLALNQARLPLSFKSMNTKLAHLTNNNLLPMAKQLFALLLYVT